MVGNTHSHGLDAWYDSLPWGQCPSEEACAGKPQAGFCEGEAHNGAWSNTVTLPGPKGGRNREYKADLHTGGVLFTRPPHTGGPMDRPGHYNVPDNPPFAT